MDSDAANTLHPEFLEKARLKALLDLDILDTEQDPRLNLICSLASEMFEVPIALITLVDDKRQWFKASVGLSICETPRDQAFCSVAIQQESMLVVENTELDARFQHNPLVTGEPHIRFYAGVQIVIGDNLRLGTLCIIDTKPRSLSPKSRRMLESLSKLVTELLAPSDRRRKPRGQWVTPRLMDAREFLRKTDQLLEQSDVPLDHLGLGIIRLNSLTALRKSRGLDYCEQVCDAMLETLHAIAPDALAVARLGFDQFSLMSRQSPEVNEDQETRDQLERVLHTPLDIHNEAIDIQAHFFWAKSLEGIRSSKQVMALITELSTADNSLEGNRRLAVYGSELVEELKIKELIRCDISTALIEKQIYFEYQPKIEAQTQAIVGFEALMRWQHDTLGAISPPRIVAAAEETGRDQRLIEYTLDEVLSQVGNWQKRGLLNQCTVAINVSASALCSPLFPGILDSLLCKHEVSGSTIEIELLENAIVNDMERCVDNIMKCRDMGVGIAIDDFGTGFSSLSYLQEIPADTLKIDRSFVSRLEYDNISAALVNSIITLGRVAGMKTVAEGVETAEQAQALREFQCDSLQGFFFSRPLAVEKAELLLQKGKVAAA